MENQRLFLVIGIAIIGIMLFSKWDAFQSQTPKKVIVGETGRPQSGNQKGKPKVTVNSNEEKKDLRPGSVQKQTEPTGKEKNPSTRVARPMMRRADDLKVKGNSRIKIKTDVYNIEIDTLGAEIHELSLVKFTISVKDRTPFPLMASSGNKLFVTESGFDMDGSQKNMGPSVSSNSIYTTQKKVYILEGGKNKLEVNFQWKSKNGIQIIKTYTFFRGRYDIHIKYKIINNSNIVWKGSLYQQLNRTQFSDSGQGMVMPSYFGAAIYTKAEGYEKIGFDKIFHTKTEKPELQERWAKGGNLNSVENGWIAMVQHNFVTSFIPPKAKKHIIYTIYDDIKSIYSVVIQSATLKLSPGKTLELNSILYAGHKDQNTISRLAENLDLTVDYGILALISKPLYWVLTFFYSIVGNWGFSIILLTILVKGLFFKLSATSYRSMAKMRKLNPRMKQLKERHGDNRQAYTLAIQEMFKKEKVNPLGGCLPILVQIPVFIALYWVLLESVELRQAPFIFWIQDLSVKDPFFILPVLMGATMFLQHKLNPPQLDPMQQKIMMALPIVFTVFFMFFSSGLVLYWLVNNILSISQQWYITKQITGEENVFSKPE